MAHIVWQYGEEWQLEMGVFQRGAVSTRSEANDEPPTRTAKSTGFVPATDKLEAVNRLSRLAGGPRETLGPGSKERKSVLLTLAHAVEPDVEQLVLNKHELAETLCRALRQPWDRSCYSEGYTITLVGLNRLLEGAERTLSADLSSRTVRQEAETILSVLRDVVPGTFIGRDAVTEMYESGSPKWAQSEWAGWFFEHLGIGACIGSLGGGPGVIPGKRTVFDFRSNYMWDFKAHSEGRDEAILNDGTAIDWALSNGGIGFVIISGRPEYEPEFKSWFDAYKVENGRSPRQSDPARVSRRLKSSFTPQSIEAFYFPNSAEWDEATRAGAITTWRQPSQPSGEARNDKYLIHLQNARKKWLVTDRVLG